MENNHSFLLSSPLLSFLLLPSTLIFLKISCGAKGIGDLGPFHIKSMAHAEEEEMSEDEQRKSRLPGYATEDDPILDEPRSQKEEVLCHQGESSIASQRKAQAPWANHRGMVEKQFQERPSPPH